MAELKMKVIGREKVETGRDEYSDFYLVQFPDYEDILHLHTTYFGNGERGGLYSFANMANRYTDGWKSGRLEDLRSQDVPVPEKIKKHILRLMKEDEKRVKSYK